MSAALTVAVAAVVATAVAVSIAVGGSAARGVTDCLPEHPRHQLPQDLARRLAHLLVAVGAHQAATFRALVAASAAVRTSASAPLRYTRPVAPIIR